MRQFYVYILASRSHRLYVGVTNNLELRLWQHKNGEHGFTAKYRVNRLVYFEMGTDALAAITREKQIKGLLRSKKIALIEAQNPKWEDLSATTADPSLRSG